MKMTAQDTIQGFLRMGEDGWKQGWHERNGGNLSYRMKEEEVLSMKSQLCPGEWMEIGTKVEDLAKEYFLVTASGGFFRNLTLDPESTMGMIQVDETGEKYRVVWGLQGSKPTSELHVS